MERETRVRTRTETRTTRKTDNVSPKHVFACGDVTVHIEFDAEAVIHNASPPGCYRATVNSNGVDHRMLISVAKFRSEPFNSHSIEEVARAALLYAAADSPNSVVLKKDGAGWPEMVKR